MDRDCWRVGNGNGGTPLHCLCRHSELDAQMMHVAVLSLPGTDVWLISNNSGQMTALHALCGNAALTTPTLILALDAAPAHAWLSQNAWGATPLHRLCSNPALSVPMLRALATPNPHDGKRAHCHAAPM